MTFVEIWLRWMTIALPCGPLRENRDFIIVKSTVKGEPEYEKGAYVHVYYRQQTDGNVVTMIMRKVKTSL